MPSFLCNYGVNIPGEDSVGNTFRAKNSAIIAFPAAVAIPMPNYIVNHIPTTTAHDRRPGTSLTATSLTIHSPANPNSNANGERGNLTNPGNQRTASFHIVVDENNAVECLPLNEVAWHVRDGANIANNQSLALEICESGDREKTLKKAIIVSAKILKDRGWDETKLKKHQDWPKQNGRPQKVCPGILIDRSLRTDPKHTWEWFKAEVKKQLGLMGLYYEVL